MFTVSIRNPLGIVHTTEHVETVVLGSVIRELFRNYATTDDIWVTVELEDNWDESGDIDHDTDSH